MAPNLRRSFSPRFVTRSADSARGATPAQIALARLLDGSPSVVPIPGTKRRRYLE
jgi:aryl-alcohol dehydrogenase-like predicted oxidoreductase